MAKINYLTRQEQWIWEHIKEMEYADNQLIKDLFPELNNNSRNKILHNLNKKGFIQRARKDLYYNPKKINGFHELALKIHEGYIGLSSALREYNLIEYEDFTIFVITKNFRKKIQLKRTQYEIEYIPFKKLFTGYKKQNNIYISDIEKTIFDCFLKSNKMGYPNLIKAIIDADIDWNKFISYCSLKKNKAIHQKMGYVLDLINSRHKKIIPKFVFDYFQKDIKFPIKLINSRGKTIFNQKWKIEDNINMRAVVENGN